MAPNNGFNLKPAQYMNPYLATGLSGLGGLVSGIGGAIFGSPERDLAETQNKMLQQKMGWGQNLWPMLMKLYQSGHSINPGQQERMAGQFGQSMMPEWNRAAGILGQTGDVRSPVMQRNLASMLFPAMAGYRQNMGMADIQGMSQLRQLLASLAG
jgi:hypothetical protein